MGRSNDIFTAYEYAESKRQVERARKNSIEAWKKLGRIIVKIIKWLIKRIKIRG